LRNDGELTSIKNGQIIQSKYAPYMKGGVGEITRTDSVNTGHGNSKQAGGGLCKECRSKS
jgi:hypothetical protein